MTQKLETKNFKYYGFIAFTFVICLITANLGATKLIQLGSLTVPGGIIIFPLLYVLNDILTEVYGFSASRRVIWIALFCNLFMTLILYIIVQIPESSHSHTHEEFSTIFALTPKIFFASLSSYFVGELLNASAISTLKIMLEGRNFAIRAILSTCVGAFIETTIFVSIAFGSFLPYADLLSMIFTMTILKVTYELIVLPFTVRITTFLKTAENIDSYEKPSWRGIFGLN
jgi:queuosine precursor transporter